MTILVKRNRLLLTWRETMNKHKSKSLSTPCLCSECPLRFQCFTNEQVFSDPLHQGLFEALMASGRTREEAIDEVTTELKYKIGGRISSVWR